MISLNIQESGKGPNLVLIHGWGMNNLVWQSWLADLEKSYRVICVELPGHGDSEYGEYWKINELLEAMAEQLPSNCSVLGWSLGGMVALAYASEYPQRINGLVMLASTPKFVQSADWLYAQPKDMFDAFADSLVKKPLVTIKRFLKLQTDGGEPSKEINNFLKNVIKKSDETSKIGLVSGLDILCHNDFRELLKNLTCPIMMLLGEKDRVVPVEVGNESININPRVEVCVIGGATHVPFLSHPFEVSQALKQFMPAGECSS